TRPASRLLMRYYHPFGASWSRSICLQPTPTPDISTLSLHDALPISHSRRTNFIDRFIEALRALEGAYSLVCMTNKKLIGARDPRSEEHTSELQSHLNLVCRLLLEKKKKKNNNNKQQQQTKTHKRSKL